MDDAASYAEMKTQLSADPIDPVGLLRACEDGELYLAELLGDPAPGDGGGDLAIRYAVHLLACLLADRPHDAKCLWKRTPEAVKASSPLLRAVWPVGVALIQGDLGMFFAAAAAVQGAPGLVKKVLGHLQDSVRSRNAALMAQAYTTVDDATVTRQLGVPPSEVSQFCTSLGWRQDAETGMWEPAAPAAETAEAAVAAEATDKINQLARHVSHLESSITFRAAP